MQILFGRDWVKVDSYGRQAGYGPSFSCRAGLQDARGFARRAGGIRGISGSATRPDTA
jgi:hypothetical protein